MTDTPGLRERKKNATRGRIWAAAVKLFDERGFDAVSVAEIAGAAEVSKMTVFNYFGSKEDIVMSALEARMNDTAAAVRDRPAGQTPHGAVEEYFLDRLAQRNPVSGLTDSPDSRVMVRIISTTPALMRRYLQYIRQAEDRLAEQLAEEDDCDEFEATILAAMIEAVRRKLIQANVIRMRDGAGSDEVYAEAETQAKWAFAVLANGLGDRLRRGKR